MTERSSAPDLSGGVGSSFLLWSESVDSFLAQIARDSFAKRRRGLPEMEAGRLVAQRYELLAPVGRGAFGAVWAALDRVTAVEVAVKLLTAQSAEESSRIRAEVASLRRIQVQGALTLLDEGVDGDLVFIVMPVVPGQPFPAVPVPARWDAIAPVTFRLLETLVQLHAQGVVHHDLKPANVLVDAGGSPIVLDFGMSSPTSFATLDDPEHGGGTPAYLAPEQIDPSARVDHRADLYALGAMLYQALSGRLPHEERRTKALLAAKFHAPPPIAELVPGLVAHVAKTVDALLARDPAERPSSAAEALRRLREPETPGRPTMAWPARVAPGERSPVGAEDLAALFACTDGYGWVQEDVAQLLLLESEGDPGAVRAILERWIGERLCRWSAEPGSALVVERGALDRHVARWGYPSLRTGAGAGETIAAAHALAKDHGRLGIASAILQGAVADLRRADAPDVNQLEHALSLLVEVALTDGSPDLVDRVLYEVCRTGPITNRVVRLEGLLRAWLAIGPWTARALELASSLPAFDEASLEVWRQAIRVLAARRTSLETERRVLDEVRAWSEQRPEAEATGRYAGWIGRLRYREGRYEEAAVHHLEASRAPLWRTLRAAATCDAASASMEAFRLEDAARLAAAAEKVFRECRQPRGYALSTWFARTVAYRRSMPQVVDPVRVDAPASLGLRELVGLGCVTEAAIAWRSGDLAAARALAERGKATWAAMGENAGALLLSTSLLVASSPPGSWPAAALAELARGAEECATPGVGIQVLGLLAAHGGPPRDVAREQRLANQVPRDAWHHRIDVLSVDEALTMLAK